MTVEENHSLIGLDKEENSWRRVQNLGRDFNKCIRCRGKVTREKLKMPDIKDNS